MRLLLVLAGGALGSGARYVVAAWLLERYGPGFPWGTLAVNVSGSLVIGMVAGLADEGGRINPDVRLLLITGVLGGYTTFSAFSLEAVRLAERDALPRALLYVSLSVTLSLAAAALGLWLARRM